MTKIENINKRDYKNVLDLIVRYDKLQSTDLKRFRSAFLIQYNKFFDIVMALDTCQKWDILYAFGRELLRQEYDFVSTKYYIELLGGDGLVECSENVF